MEAEVERNWVRGEEDKTHAGCVKRRAHWDEPVIKGQ